MEFVKYVILEEFWSEEDGYYYVWWDKEFGLFLWLMSDLLYV